MTRIADSSFIIALYDGDDPRCEVARELAADPEPIEVPPEVLGETLGVVHIRRGYEAARTIWETMGDIPNLWLVQSTDMEHTSEVYARGGGRLSWVDAAVVAACEREEAAPLCFDADITAAVPRASE